MISCQLQGAMANQIFQMAGTIALAKRNNFDYAFDLRSYTPLQGHQAIKYRDSVYKKIPKLHNHDFKYHYKEPSHGFSPLPSVDDMLIVNSYLQSPLYFEDYLNEIIDLFDFSQLFEYNWDFSVIHVRRGDYLKFPEVHPELPLEYYYEAMEICGKNSQFLFVSDDINYVRKNFKGSNINYSSFTSEIDDFRLLKFAKNIVAANSSFSVLAGIFNKNNGIKIAPGNKYPYFGPAGPKQNDIIIEKLGWIKL